jgi:hypothetical protein
MEPPDWEYELYMNEFSEEKLRKILIYVDMRTVIKTQKLSLDFIFNVILKNLQTAEEKNITLSDILKYQSYTDEEIAAYEKS